MPSDLIFNYTMTCIFFSCHQKPLVKLDKKLPSSLNSCFINNASNELLIFACNLQSFPVDLHCHQCL